jgi:hypothetical protein
MKPGVDIGCLAGREELHPLGRALPRFVFELFAIALVIGKAVQRVIGCQDRYRTTSGIWRLV